MRTLFVAVMVAVAVWVFMFWGIRALLTVAERLLT